MYNSTFLRYNIDKAPERASSPLGGELTRRVVKLVKLKEQKTEVINRFKTHAKDTGSAPVQIAVLTQQINQLNEHFKSHKKDHHSRRGMLMLIGRRRRILDYLQKQDPKKYEETINKLDLRK